MKYLKRYIEDEIATQLRLSGVVVVAGPKYCGKTTTSRLFAKSSFALTSKDAIARAEMEPSIVLEGDSPRLIDEWQFVPDLWNVARAKVDELGEKGLFIFTGSSTPADMSEILHDGSGRIVTVKMRPLSLFESGESSGLVSLSDLFEGKDPSGGRSLFFLNDGVSLEQVAFLICRGGWPDSLLLDKNDALRTTKNYFDTLFTFSETKNGRFRNKKPETFRRILRSYGRNISTEAKKTTILGDIAANDGKSIDMETLESYIEALKDLYIIADAEAWQPNIRSKSAMITTHTRHFTDTSIACAALGVRPMSLVNDLKTFGLFFEDFAVRDLSIYAQSLGGEVRHFRNNARLECDAVIFDGDGNYGLVEIKLGQKEAIADGCDSLNRVERELLDGGYAKPAFKMVLTAIGDAMKRNDIYVVPLNALKA